MTSDSADRLPELLRRNNISVAGEGPPIVFAHGLGCDQRMWRFVAAAFEKSHQRVLFDHVGSGRSDHSAYRHAKYQSLSGYAEDVLQILEALNLQDVVFVGHSVSAMIGVLAAIRSPSRFSSLVMLGPSPRYVNDDDYVGGFSNEDIRELLQTMTLNYAGWINQMVPVVMACESRPDLMDELADSFAQTDPAIMRHFAEVAFLSDTRAVLQQCQVPSLILQSRRDVIVPVEVGEYLHRHLPNSRYLLMKATGHYPHLSAPDEVIQAMRNFVCA